MKQPDYISLADRTDKSSALWSNNNNGTSGVVNTLAVLKDDQTEVQIMENVDYGETDLRAVIEGDSRGHRDQESFSKHGYTKQEFDGEELVDVDEDEDEDYESEIDDSYDDIEE